MTEYSKYNLVYRLQKWMDSVPGQTFLNYAYSWGASIVILGTLFKLTHLPGANLMLFLGMGTEVFVFFLSAFDRPFDKTAIGKEIPTHVQEDEPDSDIVEKNNKPLVSGGTVDVAAQGQPMISGTVQSVNTDKSRDVQLTDRAAVHQMNNWIQQQQLATPEMEEATNNYIEELKKLTEMLGKVSEQSARLTRDSEEMENLNRTLTGICKVYEMQLKGASAQIGTIDQINEQSNKMAKQIEQLNAIYTRMIEAMTVNMRAAAPVQPQQ